VTEESRKSPLLVLPVGAFGRAVAHRMAAATPSAVIVDPSAALSVETAAPVVLAAWRETPALARALDGHPGIPWWVPVVYDHPSIRVGPLLGAGLPGCYDCLTRRTFSASERPELRRGLWEEYDRDPALGVQGFLPHHAVIAASLAAAVACSARSDMREILVYDVLRGGLDRHTFLPLATCERWTDDGIAGEGP
jgi:hypothetical protein